MPRRREGYTLLEMMVAMTVLAIVATMAFASFIALLRRVTHAEGVVKGATEVRYAADMISQSVRGAPQTPLVQASGCDLVVMPYNLGYATVEDVTWIDAVHNMKGSKSNQRVLKLSSRIPAAATSSIFTSTARPTGAVASTDIATYFKDSAQLATIDLNDLFAVGGTISIPATAYGSAVTRTINSISNNSGNKTLTATSNWGVNIPNGTKIFATGGRRILFRVTSTGDLRYYPDNRDMNKYSVLATDINPAPLVNPAETTSGTTVPFSITGNYLTLNLQKIPAGRPAGRTLQGFQTSVYVRTDPLIP